LPSSLTHLGGLSPEEFGDGIMSAIDFDMTMERLLDARATACPGLTRPSTPKELASLLLQDPDVGRSDRH
jgi:hypothetical protein